MIIYYLDTKKKRIISFMCVVRGFRAISLLFFGGLSNTCIRRYRSLYSPPYSIQHMSFVATETFFPSEATGAPTLQGRSTTKEAYKSNKFKPASET